ncbi:hypothetical protein [Rhodococcus koreensis]
MNVDRRPRKVPNYRGEGANLSLSGSALVIVAVAIALVAVVPFGIEHPITYVFGPVAGVFGALGLWRIYRGRLFTEMESRIELVKDRR